MTLDKHRLDGISQISAKTLPTSVFETLLMEAGYSKIGTAPAQGNRIKAWWSHSTSKRVEVIYSPDRAIAI
ncbi:hypothetical protein [Chroococcus sp. FPU101]|uniref:hypothetical protein n=1 Tax=Chroococcus sp. FPU101 TaxID=1974212 RepID=UPI001A8CC452|nr:hypothetical protein [Chroococcus sp. FPU101]GFE71267.1 hypothetical protein CFPU101_38770 [Chroococcus sp. FPU101]